MRTRAVAVFRRPTASMYLCLLEVIMNEMNYEFLHPAPCLLFFQRGASEQLYAFSH